MTAPGPPDLRVCRNAARTVRASPYWRQIRDVVRPPGDAIHRSRPPLSLRLYAAARDGRLVWRSQGEFAVLEPPIVHERDWVTSDAGRTWLSRLDRWWGHVMFGGPPVLALLLSVPTAFLPRVGPIPAVLLICLAMLYVTAQLTIGRARSALRSDTPSEDTARGLHWTITLSHVSDPRHLDRLLRTALDRSRRLTTASLRPDPADGTHVIMCLERGMTTGPAREAARTAPSVVSADSTPSGVFVVRDGGEFQPPKPEAHRPMGFIPLLLAAAALTVSYNALIVAGRERAACTAAGDCTGRPASWPDAALWLLGRMYFQDNGFVPATGWARTLGLLMPVLAGTVLLCMIVAGRRQIRSQRERAPLRYQHLQKMIGSTMRILVLVVLDIERDAVIDAVAKAGGHGAEPDTVGTYPVFRLGMLDGREIFLAQTAQGTVTPASMMPTATGLLQALQPDYVVLSGICFGLWSRELDGGDQELGDVVVSEYVQGVDHRRVTDRDGVERTFWRGERVQATTGLFLAFRAATHGWMGPRVHFGAVLSSNTFSDSAAYRAELRQEFPEASAGEMELTAVYAAAVNQGCGWIMVKGISDWGAGGLVDDTRRPAARAAAAFVVHAITQPTLPRPRRDHHT